jgi:hypothetical protein
LLWLSTVFDENISKFQIKIICYDFPKEIRLYILTLSAKCPTVLKQCFSRFSTTEILMAHSENSKSSFPRVFQKLDLWKTLGKLVLNSKNSIIGKSISKNLLKSCFENLIPL